MTTITTRKVVYYTDGTAFGGSEQALLHLMSKIDRASWEPVLFHAPHPGLSHLLKSAQDIDIPVVAVPALPLGINGLRQLPAFIRHLKATRPDVFHANLNSDLSCKWGLVGAILAGVPAILATHHLFIESHFSRLARLQQRLISRGIGRYIVISSEMVQQLRRAFWLPAEKIEVIFNGIRLDQLVIPADVEKRASLVGNLDQPVVLSVARYAQQKGLNFLIEAAAKVPRAAFLFAGEGPEHAALEQQAEALGLADRVHFLGYRHDVPDLLAICDLFVLPSVYEGMPLALMEAMGAGKPVIATDLPGCRELVKHGENGWLVPAADAPALVEAIQYLLTETTLAGRLAKAGQAHVREHLSIEVVAERITQIYTELLMEQDGGQANRLKASASAG